jgi:2-methylisocitrate lyase-like PEP mutase family enzyme
LAFGERPSSRRGGTIRPSEIRAVAPKPVNILISGAIGLTMRDAAELGARHVSVGGAFARAAWGGFIRSAQELIQKGSFEKLASATSYPELQDFFGRI